MTVHTIASQRSIADMLETLGTMRQDIVDGKAVAMAAVLVDADDVTHYYTAASGSVTKLRVVGAVSALHGSLIMGVIG